MTATAPASPAPPAPPALSARPALLAPQLPIASSPPKSEPDSPYREWRVLIISCLTSIATIIGSGILALPVTLHATSVPVFLTVFTLTLLTQIGAIYAVVELMQRAGAESSRTSSYSAIDRRPPDVSLFSMAHHYLPSRPLQYAFYAATILSFVSVLVSYGLAGPQAVWQLLSPGETTHPPTAMFAAYWALGTVAVVFFVDQLLAVFGSFTVLKGALFVCVVAIVAALPPAARVTSLGTLFSDFSGISRAAPPFLMSCVAIGGLSNTMPVTYKLLPVGASRAQVARYRAAIILAVVLCYLLNIGWVIAVLQVVPRTAAEGAPNLTTAYKLGQISTVPLINALHIGDAVQGAVLTAIEVTVELFIFVSTGVSFFVTSAGMKSFVDGGVATLTATWPSDGVWGWAPTVTSYFVAFGSVLAIVIANPNGFIAVLTRFSSIALNLQAGALLFVMLYYSRRPRSENGEAEQPRHLGEGEEGQANTITEGDEDIEASVEAGQPGPDGKARVADGIALEMGPAAVWGLIWVCIPFFTFACILAVVGPLLGVKLRAGE